MNGLLQDVGYALRQLRKNPGFTVVAVLTLALGIGANTAIFTMVQGVVLAPLPFREPDRLVTVWQNNLTLKRIIYVSYPDFLDWQRSAHAFEQMAAFTSQSFDLTNPGIAEHVNGKEISSGFFGILGAKLALGRDFLAEEDKQGGAPGVIISDRLWNERFARSLEALGKSLTLSGANYTVVGVVAPGFHLVDEDADVYTPLGQEDLLIYGDRTIHPIFCIGRLKPGVSVAEAQSEMRAIQQGLNQLYPAADKGLGADILPLKQVIVGDTRGTLLLLLGAVGIVLLIACANVANLLLTRAAARTREFAIRSALGADRMRIAQQIITESVLLSLAGGALGLAVAKWGLAVALVSLSSSLPRSENIAVNLPVLLFTSGISIVVGILFGLAPALQGSKADLQIAMKAEGRGVTRGRGRTQSGLVIAQMALSLVLLTGAGLLLRTIRNLWQANPGFDAQHLITFKLGLSPALTKNVASERTAYQQLIERIRQIPGVQSAALTALVPLSQQDNTGPFWTGPQKPASIAEAPRATFYWTDPEYLRTMGIPLLRGRFFHPEDTTSSERVIVIDNVLAHAYFSDKDPLGETIVVPHWGSARVIGVVGHVRHWDLRDSNQYTQNQIYVSYYQLRDEWVPVFREFLTVVVRTPLDSASLMSAIKQAAYGADSAQAVYSVRTMQELVSESMSPQRFPMVLLGLFAGLALLLATVGIYGVISYSVKRRVLEIGIRMALGASRLNVFRMIIGQGLRLALIGLALGIAIAFALMRLLSGFSHLLYGVGANDGTTFASVSIVLIGVAFLACYIPARRAAKADPMEALRYE